MAEIKVEKKKSVWPWILGILAVLLVLFLIWMFAEGDDDNMDDVEDDDIEQVEQYEIEENTDNEYPNNAVAAYLSYVDEERPEEIGEDPEATQEALLRLNAAVEEKANELRYDLDKDLKDPADTDGATTDAMRDPTQTSTDQNANIASAGEKVVNALEELQEMHFPELDDEVQELRDELNEISSNANAQTNEQAEEVLAFFNQAADVLREMEIDVDTTPSEREEWGEDTTGTNPNM